MGRRPDIQPRWGGENGEKHSLQVVCLFTLYDDRFFFLWWTCFWVGSWMFFFFQNWHQCCLFGVYWCMTQWPFLSCNVVIHIYGSNRYFWVALSTPMLMDKPLATVSYLSPRARDVFVGPWAFGSRSSRHLEVLSISPQVDLALLEVPSDSFWEAPPATWSAHFFGTCFGVTGSPSNQLLFYKCKCFLADF